MSRMIADLHDLRFIDVASAGEKGATLGELAWQGFPIPPGFVILAEAYKTFFRQVNLHSEFSDLDDLPLDELELRYARIRDTIQQMELAPELTEAIFGAYHRLTHESDAPFTAVVRSSATTEDRSDINFAGQHDTYYYVDESHLLSMIKYCWASLWRPEAVLYRAARRIDHNAVFMAVIVQEMIPAEISGAAWSMNPATGAQQTLLIEAGWGMGAAVVDGRMTPDRYLIDRREFTVQEKRIAEKRMMVPFLAGTRKNGRLQDVPYPLRHQETLSDEIVTLIAQWAVKAEEHFGSPQEIEWVIAHDQVFFLQSRPAMSEKPEISAPEHEGQYAFSPSVAEHVSDPLSPLSADLLSRFLPAGVRLIHGRFYCDIKRFHRFVPFHLSEQEMSRAVSGNSVELLLSAPVVWLKLPLFLLRLWSDSRRLRSIFARIYTRSDDFMERRKALLQEVEQDPAFDPVKILQNMFWPSGFLASFGAGQFWETLSQTRHRLSVCLFQKLLHFWASDLREEAAAICCTDPERSFSTALSQELLHLVQEASQSPSLRTRLCQQPPEQTLPLLEKEFAEHRFFKYLQEFLARYGHRAFKAFELQAARWEEYPAPLLGLICNYLNIDTDLYTQKRPLYEAQSPLNAAMNIRQRLAHLPFERTFYLRWRLLRWLARYITSLSQDHENALWYYNMGMSVVRKKILAIESELIKQGKLRCKDDIFFLYWDEIVKLQQGQFVWEDVEDRIHTRHLEYVRLSKQAPLKTLGFIADDSHRPGKHRDSGKEQVYRGIPLASGWCEGTARVISDPAVDARFTPGEILIAPYTSPVWTPLLLLAAGVILEAGNVCSHAGMYARAYGIPCIAGVTDCTTQIRTGDRVVVDANQGVVKVLL